ncbi:MAG TPA: quinolinate synthase [Deltaproteobacteria bacterium]|nr:quinolinate synthase [Deltaproteobacteria bacterium]
MEKDIANQAREDVLNRIADLKTNLGRELLIFAHFYQSDSIVRFADFVGDSLQLAHEAARRSDKRYLVVCAVSFMAEMVRILCDTKQTVLLPSHEARCPLAEMAPLAGVEEVWNKIVTTDGGRIIPVVYVNSTSEMKAFCGRHGGLVCTSSNASKVFEWVLGQGARLFFFPDENLGRNTAAKLGIEKEDIFLVDPGKWKTGSALQPPSHAKILLWRGFCYVHQEFLMEQIERVKGMYPGMKVAVHPECVPQVCNAADIVGATSTIKAAVEKAPPGSRWAIGTEWNLVNRLQKGHPDQVIIPLQASRCEEMAMIEPERLLEVLEGIALGQLKGTVAVREDVSDHARTALQRMLEIA